MTRHHFIISLCFFFLSATCVFGESIKLELIARNDQLTIDHTHQLSIKISDIDMFSLVFTAQPAPNEPQEATTWKFYADYTPYEVTEYHTIAGEGIAYCVDQITGNFWSFLEYSQDGGGSPVQGTKFTLSPSDRRHYAQLYNSEHSFGTWDLLCPIRFTNTDFPQSTNLQVSYVSSLSSSSPPSPLSHIVNTEPTIVNIKLDKYTHFSNPEVVIDKVVLIHEDEESPFSASTLKLTFHTDSTGYFELFLDNGPMFYPVSYTTGQPADFFCMKNGNAHDKTIRIVYLGSQNARIHISTPSNNHPIECHFTLRSQYNSVSNTQSDIALTLSHSNTIITQYITSSRRPASFRVDVLGFSKTDLSLGVVAISSSATSTTPIYKNSTIEYRFFDHSINLNNLVITDDEKKVGGWTCFGPDKKPLFQGTISTPIKDSFFITDITAQSFTTITTSCVFKFSGEDTYDFSKSGVNGGKLAVFVDGVALSPNFGDLDSSFEPFYFPHSFNLSTIRAMVMGDGQGDGSTDSYLSYYYDFEISDNYSNNPSLPNNPILILSLTGSFPWNSEDFSKQLSCKYNHKNQNGPNSDEKSPLNLSFNHDMYAWEAKLSDLIKPKKGSDPQSYHIQLSCHRRSQRLIKYGLDITPRLDIQVEVIDLIDSHRYVFSTKHQQTATEPEFKAEIEPPSQDELPKDPIQRVCLSGHLELPSLHHFVDNDTILMNSMKNLLNDIINFSTPDSGISKLTMIHGYPLVSLSLENLPTYATDMKSAADLNHYYYSTLNYDFTPFEANVPMPFIAAGAETDPLQGFYQKITVSYKVCFGSTKPFGVDNQSEFQTILKEKIVLKWYGDYLKRVTREKDDDNEFVFDDEDSNYIDVNHYPIDGIDTTLPSPKYPLFAFRHLDPTTKQSVPDVFNTISTCGLFGGYQVPTLVTPDNTSFLPYDWSWYSTLPQDSFDSLLCQVGDKCTISADCDQTSGLAMCKNEKCTIIPQRLSPYIDYRSVISEFYKHKYYNHKTPFVVWFFVIGGLLFLAFGAVLFSFQKQPQNNINERSGINEEVNDEHLEALIQ
jgi:hypothetical protein